MHILFMKKLFLLALIVLLAVSEDLQTFDEWKAACGKSYANESDEAYRRSVYQENLEEIRRTNAENLGYTLKPNCHFGDRTTQERQDELVVKVGQSIPQRVGKVKVGSSALPTSVDWRDEGMVSSIKNQGTCGSCWSFTTAALYESIVMIAGMSEYDLSEEYILECTTVLNNQYNIDSSCAGGLVDDAIPLAVTYGMPLQSQYPYISYNYGDSSGFATTAGICDVSDTSSWIKENISGAYATYRDLSASAMKELITYAPIVALIYADSGFMNLGSGVYSGCPSYSVSKDNINHAVVIVGYDSNGNYIVKNSWDTTWGVNGYGTVSASRDCGLAAYVYEIRGTNQPTSGSGTTEDDATNAQTHLQAFMAILLILSLIL